MSKFIDVQPYSWYYNQIEDLADLKLQNNTPFLTGITYNVFQNGKSAIDYTYSDGSAHSEKVVNFVINATDDNPLIAFVNGVSIVIDEVTPNETDGTTYIKYRRMIPANAKVRLVYGGEPLLSLKIIGENAWLRLSESLDDYYQKINSGTVYDIMAVDGNWFKVWETSNGSDFKYVYNDENVTVDVPAPRIANGSYVAYPSADLGVSGNYAYVYDPYYMKATEKIICNGAQLERVENSSLIQNINEYAIENGKLFVHYNLNNSIVEGTILTRYLNVTKSVYISVIPHSDNILYMDRFFPDLDMSRMFFIILLNKLRMNYYLSYSDVEPPRNTSKTTSKYTDIQAALTAAGDTPPYWWEHFRDLEDMRCPDGSRLFNGIGNNVFGINVPITRADAAILLNRFRKIMVEAFK